MLREGAPSKMIEKLYASAEKILKVTLALGRVRSRYARRRTRLA